MSRAVVTPKCEICKAERAIIFAPDCGGYPSVGAPNDWKFLCKKCNTLLGMADDNIQTLLMAINYLDVNKL